MSFVEAVTLERFKQVPKFLRFFLCHSSVSLASLYEFNMLFCHFLTDFFTYRFSEFIHFTPVVSSDFDRGIQKVILVNKHTESFIQEVFHFWMVIHDRFFTIFTCNVFLDVIHRSRSVQSHHNIDIVDHCRF